MSQPRTARHIAAVPRRGAERQARIFHQAQAVGRWTVQFVRSLAVAAGITIALRSNAGAVLQTESTSGDLIFQANRYMVPVNESWVFDGGIDVQTPTGKAGQLDSGEAGTNFVVSVHYDSEAFAAGVEAGYQPQDAHVGNRVSRAAVVRSRTTSGWASVSVSRSCALSAEVVQQHVEAGGSNLGQLTLLPSITYTYSDTIAVEATSSTMTSGGRPQWSVGLNLTLTF
jgi:hypothetical protein